MKVITTKAAYLQKYYFDILLKSTLVTKVGVPLSICDVVNKRKFDKYDSKDFIKFTKREEIEFLKNATWIPKAYYKIKTSEAADLTSVEVWTPIQDSGYSYIQIKDDCKIDKLKNEIYILVEGTL